VTEVTIRPATLDDAPAMHALIAAHLDEGHLLPRQLDDLERHAARFIVCDVDGEITACAALVPLSPRVTELRRLATAAGFETLSAFTHDARFFVRQNFSIVPHLWLPEKIATDCLGCPLFRKCSQYAMVLPLREATRFGVADAPSHRVAVA
jgi:N-acetylglutamate synthase-like GNAT family acetyltransferase